MSINLGHITNDVVSKPDAVLHSTSYVIQKRSSQRYFLRRGWNGTKGTPVMETTESLAETMHFDSFSEADKFNGKFINQKGYFIRKVSVVSEYTLVAEED